MRWRQILTTYSCPKIVITSDTTLIITILKSFMKFCEEILFFRHGCHLQFIKLICHKRFWIYSTRESDGTCSLDLFGMNAIFFDLYLEHICKTAMITCGLVCQEFSHPCTSHIQTLSMTFSRHHNKCGRICFFLCFFLMLGFLGEISIVIKGFFLFRLVF